MATLLMSQRLVLTLVETVLAALGTAHAAQALTLVTDRTALGADQTVEWGVLPNGVFLPNPSTVSASGGTQVTASMPSGHLVKRNPKQ